MIAIPQDFDRDDGTDDDRVTPLTHEEVLEIVRLMGERRQYRLKAIANRFGVSITTIRRIHAKWTER